MDKQVELVMESALDSSPHQGELMSIENHEAVVTAAHHQAIQALAKYDRDKDEHEVEYAKMQQQVAQVLASLMADENMSKFRTEYEKMNKAVFQSKENIEKYYNHYTTLEREYRTQLDAGHEAYKTTFNDATQMRHLKSQIAKLHEQMEGSTAREESGKEELRLLRMEISSLLMTLKQGVGLSVVQERTLMELNQTKEQMTRELEQELDKIVQLRNSISDVSEKIKQSEDQRRLCETDIFELKEMSATKKSDIDQEMRNKERLEYELRELRVVVGNKTNEVRAKQEAVNRSSEEITMLENQFKAQKQALERLVKDHESLTIRAVKLKQECGDQINGAIHLREQNEALVLEIKLKENDLLRCKAEIKKINKIKEGLIKKNRSTDEIKCDLEAKRRKIKDAIDSLVSQEARIKRQNEVHKKMIDDLSRERDIIFANEQKGWNETQRSLNLSAPYRQIKENLEFEIMRFQKELADHENTIKRISLEKDFYIREATGLQAQCVQCLDKIKDQENVIYEFKKQMVGTDTKLKHQQALYEAVQSDRNLHAKHLVEALAEISEMKRKLRIMNYQINGYKDDIKVKQDYLLKAQSESSRLKKDIEMINDEIKTLKSQNELAQAYIRTQLAEELRLNQFVKESEMERNRQVNSLQVLHNERDNLSDQLIKQNEELGKIYEKIKSQHTQLLTNQKLYQQRLSQISVIRQKVVDARHMKEKLKNETQVITDLRHIECRLFNEIMFEKTRVKALKEQIKHPVNIHRWRKLEGSDPKMLEMIHLMHALQKKIKSKVELDEDLAKQLSLHQDTYLQCKALISKQIGPEALEQLSEYEKIYKEKQNQLRHLDSELHMYQAQSREYKHSLCSLDQELGDLKKKYVQEWFKQYQEYNPTLIQKKLPFKSVLAPISKDQSLPPLPKLVESAEPSDMNSAEPFQSATASDTQALHEASTPEYASIESKSPLDKLSQPHATEWVAPPIEDQVNSLPSQDSTPLDAKSLSEQAVSTEQAESQPSDQASQSIPSTVEVVDRPNKMATLDKQDVNNEESRSSSAEKRKTRPTSTLAEYLPLEALPAGYQIPEEYLIEELTQNPMDQQSGHIIPATDSEAVLPQVKPVESDMQITSEGQLNQQNQPTELIAAPKEHEIVEKALETGLHESSLEQSSPSSAPEL